MLVISIIGMITPLALPQIGAMSSAASTAAQERNAQNIVSVFRAGKEAGSIEWNTSSRNAAVADVIAGRKAPSTSIFAGNEFSVPNIKGDSLTGLYKYIGLDARKNLFFDRTGSQPVR
jgi:type IV pilus assembly protein PilA